MGLLQSKLLELFQGKKECRILMVGLDSAGKTTVLYQLKLSESVTTIPTIGFNVETVEYNNVNFTVWDVGGQTRIRPLWRHYTRNSNGVIFVVDCNDEERVKTAREELFRLIQDDDLRDAAFLIMANKQDMPNALSCSDLTSKLGLHDVRSHKWYVQGTCAQSGEGIYEGLNWLSTELK
mmetsp:Transcript_20373/g.36241  ORF Transcript_20373/g.36241 Transcript_20373/m.36241 type:complete len:179 (-) Transcript_20373:81-617(-)